MVYRFSPDAQDYFHDVEDKWKKGVAEKAEAIIIESGHKVDSDDERKFIKSLIGTMFIDKLERQSLSFYTLSFALKQTHPKAHGRSDSQSCGHFFGNLIEQQNITIIKWGRMKWT